jgi:hypothetical protein
MWKFEDLIAKVYQNLKEGKGIPDKMENLALNYFEDKPDSKEGWKFLDYTHEEL